jgi:dolichol-phosphate mannosyltransferase
MQHGDEIPSVLSDRPRSHGPADPSARPTLSLVIPVFNEGESLPVLLQRLQVVIAGLGDTPVEVIFVDDHSTDDSPALLRAACQRDPRLRCLRLSRNSGSHIAILAGLEHSTGQCAVFMASDLQDPPELIPTMLASWRAGNQIVWAVREEREEIPWTSRAFAHAFYKLFNRLAHVTLPPQGSDFALVDRALIQALRRSASATLFLMGEIARLGFRQAEVPYVKERRQFGRTKWSLSRKLRTFADAFVAFSYAPLRVMSFLGILFSIVGFFFAIFYTIDWFLTKPGVAYPGWTSTIVLVLLIGGIQMTMLGVLGEYLWRTLEEARRRPPYFVEDAVGLDDRTDVVAAPAPVGQARTP